MTELTQSIVKEFFDYCPVSGITKWNIRDSKWFNDTSGRSAEHTAKIWNNRYAGKEFGYLRNKDQYLETKIFDKLYKVHRLIWLWMTGEWPKFEIDHENGIRNDNRWKNLRDVTHRENMMNQKCHRQRFSPRG